MKPLFIEFEQCAHFFKELIKSSFTIEISSEKHKLLIFENEEKIADFLLPLPLPSLESNNFQEYITHNFEVIPNYVIYMIQAGSCALAYYEGDELIEHKVFKTYMVRKKQGKSQIKHLKSKGKSKAGSRVRLSNTIHFFEQINGRLQEYFNDYHVEKIIYACPTNMISLFYESKILPPFDRTDERLIKIPIDIQQPCFEELLKINHKICLGKLTFYNVDFEQQLKKMI